MSNGTNKGAVLVTGASRGLGQSIALELSILGYKVFAGIRNPKDSASFRAENNISPVMLDVTKPDSVNNAYNEIASEMGEEGIVGLVNNAGIGIFGPVEQVPLEIVEEQFRVNVFGVIAVSQKFLPLLRKAQGRIINISSINGELSIPTSGIYSASKFALEAISDALRMELKPWGIHVSVVQPGVTSTDIRTIAMNDWGKRHEQLSGDKQKLYGSLFEKSCALIENMEKTAAGHEDVTKSVIEALTSETPFSRKMAGPDVQQWKEVIQLTDDKRDETLLSFWN